MGAKLWTVHVRSLLDTEDRRLIQEQAPAGKEILGFRCNSRLYEMAMLKDDATLADKICLANDLKHRRDHQYAEALLFHIFPGMPKIHILPVLQSHGVREWMASDPRGQWCSQNDKAFMYMTVKNYVYKNRRKIIPFAWMHKIENGASKMTALEQNEKFKSFLKSWRGANLEDLDGVAWESTTSEVSRPKPLDNSICPSENLASWFGTPRRSSVLEQARIGNLKAKMQHDRLQIVSLSECLPEEGTQDNQTGFGGANGNMSESEERALEEALRGMNLDCNPSRGVSEQETGVDSSKAHEQFVARRVKQVREMKRQLLSEVHARRSGNALMKACRKPKVVPTPNRAIRRSARLADRAETDPFKGGAGRARFKSSRAVRREQQCNEDFKQLLRDPHIQLPPKRQAQVCKRLGTVRERGRNRGWTEQERTALLELANIYPFNQPQHPKTNPAVPRTSLSTVEYDSSQAHQESSTRFEAGLSEPANANNAGEQGRTTGDDTLMDCDGTENTAESMDMS